MPTACGKEGGDKLACLGGGRFLLECVYREGKGFIELAAPGSI
jgi:hypothetical protein